jgi:nucleotide-binding universal stress UspA family protein
MPRSLGYRRILVPISENVESEKAMDVACRLAAEHGASITVVAVVEVPPLLPLDAHMVDEEAHAHRVVERATAIADSYGVGIAHRILRAREAARAIVDEAKGARAEILVIGAPRKTGARARNGVFGTTVEHVLKRAPCRVMLIGTRLNATQALQNAAA